MTQSNSEITDRLAQASSGLLFVSESESPFEVFVWESPLRPLNPEKILQQTSHPQDTPVEVVGLDDFFKVATTEEDWQDTEEKKTVAKYQTLVETLKANLTDLNVYRLGNIEIDVYIVGQTPSGDLAGLSTHVVET